MKIMKPLALGVLTRPIEFQRRFFLCVATTTFCPIGHEAAILGDIAMWKMLAEEMPPTEPLDMVFPKTAGEFLVAARAYAPGGVPARAVPVGVRLGGVSKRLLAVGDRHFEEGRPTEPVPFNYMPLGWDRAYGGSKVAENPHGVGTEEKPLQGIGFRIPLPNIVHADRTRSGPPEPLGFGQIDIAWPQRTKLAGTYDKRWLDEDFPGLARDIDFRMFMAAPPDQRFPRPLQGDEDYEIENMHPEEPLLTGRLPSIQPRVLIQRKGATLLEDVPVALTTVWFFPHRKRLVLIHHGRIRVAEEDARDVTLLMLGADRLGAARPVAEFEAVKTDRDDPDYGTIRSLQDSALVPAELLPEDSDTPLPKVPLMQQRMERRKALALEKARGELVALGLDPERYGIPKPGAPEPPITLETLPARIEKILKDAERLEAETREIGLRKEAEAKARADAHGLNMPPASQKPSGPPTFSAAAERAKMEALAASLEASGQNAAVLRDMLADTETMARWERAEAQTREGYRQTAGEQDPARPLSAGANAALRTRLFNGARDARDLNMCGANLAGLDLAGFDFTDAWLDGADLTGANLVRARFERAVVAHARLEGARLAGADLTAANFSRTAMGGADLSGAVLREAILDNADLRGANLRRSILEGARLMGVLLDGADLSDADARDFFAHDIAIAKLRAVGANLDNAVFIQCDLTGADLAGASLCKASFITVKAAGIVLAGADLAGSVFTSGCDLTGANLAGARCKGTNFRGSAMAGTDLGGALLDDSDFSDCDLSGASFDLACARRTRFIVADLRGAVMTRADFMGASLARADLRGANLSDSSLYEVDLARINADAATRYERIQRTRTKLVPRRVPA